MARLQTGTRAEINNPGPVFDNVEAAALDVLSQVNPISIANNTEYAWLLYFDKNTGLIGYTDPMATGPAGSEEIHFFVDTRSKVLFGMGHTRADYSWALCKDCSILRSEQFLDKFHSDEFSKGGPGGDMEYMGANQHHWSYYFLGTPSGRFLEWTPWDGVQSFP